MNFETTNTFDNQAKKLSKKYPQLKKDLINFIDNYEKNHKLSISIKNNIYKTRIKNSNKNRGKSAGYRVYYYVEIQENVYFLTIYDKSEIEMIDENILFEIINNEVFN